MLIAHHRVPATAFSLLAHGYADATVMGLLRAGRMSKQTLLIRAVVDAARPFRGAFATAGLDDAVQLIDETQRSSPAAAASVLGYPLVGAWAAHCLRRLRRPADTGTPLWVDLAHLAAIAAAAAIRGGLDIALPVPIRSGVVSLPTLGCARLGSDATWGSATVRGRAGGYLVAGQHGAVTVPADPDQECPGWNAVHQLAVTDRDQTMTVFLDDRDPYRNPGLAIAGRLDTTALADWRSQLTQAWRILVRNHPERATELAAGPITMVPLANTSDAPHVSGTTRDSAGAMALTPPPDPFVLAMAMVHELQHSKLGALLDLVELYNPGERRRFYSPWRADPRPIGGLFQGAYAFLAVGAFWKRYAFRDTGLVSPQVAEYELARTSEQVRGAVRDLAASGALTPPGIRFVAGLSEAADALANRRVATEAARLARLVREDHRVTWRLRNLRVEPATIGRLAEAWQRSERRPVDHPPGRLAAQVPPNYAEQPRHELVRRAVDDPTVLDAGPDAALIAGNYPAAAHGYLMELAAEPVRPELWAGLALARQLSGPQALARTYSTEPELLSALYERLTADHGTGVDIDALAGWLAG